ncbi:MAG: CHAD domain-containing protein [Planctomycetes bacterium]|nr:CHAD domain-containing protein [Planctomycetota bacterium]
MPDTLETEFKLRALRPLEVAAVDAALRELGVTCRGQQAGQHVDAYLDDAAGSLHDAGIGLRLRSTRTGHRLTCKARTPGEDGLFVRVETEAEWPSGEPPAKAGDLPPPLRDLVEPFVLDRALQVVLRLQTERDTRRVAAGDLELCELAIDRVEAHAGGRSVAFQEIELEVVDDTAAVERLAHGLRERLPLDPADDDKPGHAAHALGLRDRVHTAAPLGADTPLADTVAAITARHFAAMQAAEVGVRADLDPEALHTMRVALRALRCIVRAFRDLWPEANSDRMLERLGEFGRRLGTVRDWDVLLAASARERQRLPESLRGAAERAEAWLAGHRTAANIRMQEWLRSASRLQELRELAQALGAIDNAAAAANHRTADAVAQRLARATASLRKAIGAIDPALPLEPVHALRIAGKRLRYLAEQFATLPGHDYDKSLQAIVLLQQALGAVCDHENAVQQLLGQVKEAAAASADGALTAATFGALAALHGRKADKARRTARKVLAEVDRKKTWRRFPGVDEPDSGVAGTDK